jgi:hypothetical protein
MEDGFKSRRLHDLVKGSLPCNISHDDHFKDIFADTLVCIPDFGRLILGADRRHNAVALFQELLEDVGCPATATTTLSA